MEVKEGLLFNRVGADGGDVAVLKGIETPADILAAGTEACLPFGNQAAPFAGKALHPVPQRLIKQSLFNAVLSHPGTPGYCF